MIVPFLYRGDASRRMRIVIANGTAGIEERGEDLAGGERWTSVDLDASTHPSGDPDCDASLWVEMVAMAVACNWTDFKATAAEDMTDEITEAYARAFASEWLRSELGIEPGEGVPEIDFSVESDGSFAFSIQADELPPGCEDSTSYMRIDAYGEVSVEWMGTTWMGPAAPERPMGASEEVRSLRGSLACIVGGFHDRHHDVFRREALAFVAHIRELAPEVVSPPLDASIGLRDARVDERASQRIEGPPLDAVLAENLRAGDVLVNEGRTMVVDDVVIDDRGVAVFARGTPGPELAKRQTVSILRRPRPTQAVGATTNESADHFGPTIEIPDLATAREYVGRVALLGHRAGGEGSIYDDAGICWGSSGTLSIGDRDRIFMAQGVTATTSRSIHDGVVIRLLDVGETIAEPPAEQAVRRRGSRALQMPEATPPQVARVLFDIADALRLDTDAAWAIEDLAAEVELAAAVMAKAGLS